MSEEPMEFHPVFWELHRELPRQGPGDDAHTRRAFGALGKLPASPRVVDLGCGPGMQTLELARLSAAMVTALDFHAPFLEELRRRAAGSGLGDRVATVVGDMNALPFPPKSIDLVWAEGAIYIVGLETGLRAWRPLLKPGGAVAVTEATWTRHDPPPELAEFWAAAYPQMGTVEENACRAEASGYRVVDTFVLPPEAWWTHYYTPIEERLPELRRRYAADPEALAALEEEAAEIELHRRYSDYYGYVFYVLRAERA